MLDKNLSILFQCTMKPIMLAAAKTHGKFLTQEEYTTNAGSISIVTGAAHCIEKKFKSLDK